MASAGIVAAAGNFATSYSVACFEIHTGILLNLADHRHKLIGFVLYSLRKWTEFHQTLVG